MKSVDFNDVYSEHAEMIYRLLMRMCNDEHLAEDLLQDTFLKAIEKIDTFDMRCKLSSWLWKYFWKIGSVGKSYLFKNKGNDSS